MVRKMSQLIHLVIAESKLDCAFHSKTEALARVEELKRRDGVRQAIVLQVNLYGDEQNPRRSYDSIHKSAWRYTSSLHKKY